MLPNLLWHNKYNRIQIEFKTQFEIKFPKPKKIQTYEKGEYARWKIKAKLCLTKIGRSLYQ